MPATLGQFASILDAVAAAPGKLAKQKILGDYLGGLPEPDLPPAVRFAAGRAFAQTDQRVLGVSGAIVTDAAMALWKIDYAPLRHAAIELGDLAEALARLFPGGGPDPPLTLHDLSAAFDDLAAAGGQELKRDLVQGLLARCNHPREVAYLCKIIFSDMRTGVAEGVLQAAVAQAFGKTTREIQHAQFLLGNLEDVAILAKKNRLAEARFHLFHPLQFMLATPVESSEALEAILAGRSFLAEDKLDGIRAQIHSQSAAIAIYTRTMDRIDQSFPDVVEAVRGLPGDFLLDGEIVAGRDGNILPFAHLQPRLGRKQPGGRVLRDNPASFAAFDLLFRDGQLLIDRPLRQRAAALEALLAGQTALRRSPAVAVRTAGEIEQAFAAARERLNEGLVIKDPESAYSPGRRGQMWFKLKTHLPTLDCVVTAAEYGHGKRRGVLSDYTFAVWDGDPPAGRLVNIGKAYSGVTDEEIRQLTELFLSISTASNGRVFKVPPKVVLEIAMDQVQRSKRHESGFALRFPRIKRIRLDKRPEDADRLARVKEIFATRQNITRKDEPVREPGLFD